MFHAPNIRERMMALRGLLAVPALLGGRGWLCVFGHSIEHRPLPTPPPPRPAGPWLGMAALALQPNVLPARHDAASGRPDDLLRRLETWRRRPPAVRCPGNVVGGKWSLLQDARHGHGDGANAEHDAATNAPSITIRNLSAAVFRSARCSTKFWGKHSGWFASADFPYWEAEAAESDDHGARNDRLRAELDTVQPVTLSRVGLDWNAGFRTAVAIGPSTTLTPRSFSPTTTPGGNSLAVGTLNPSPLGVPTPLVTTGHSNLDFNVIDFAIGQWFQPTKRIDFH